MLRTVNPRLHPEEAGYVVDHAGDRVVVHEAGPRPLGTRGALGRVLLDYETAVAAEDPGRFVEPEVDERAAASMCHASGTTGKFLTRALREWYAGGERGRCGDPGWGGVHVTRSERHKHAGLMVAGSAGAAYQGS